MEGLIHADFGSDIHKSVHELWGGKLTIFELLPESCGQGRELQEQRKSRACFWDRSRETERVACPMARADQKVSSKKTWTAMGIEKLAAEEEVGAFPGARGEILCARGGRD